MSTRGPRRWCPMCKGQVYYHHTDDAGDVWYCQCCAKEIAEGKALKEAIAIATTPKK